MTNLDEFLNAQLTPQPAPSRRTVTEIVQRAADPYTAVANQVVKSIQDATVVVPLAPPDNDSKHMQHAPDLRAAIDDQVVEAVARLDKLIGAIEKLKQSIIEDGAILKDHIGKHSALGAEAMGFHDLVMQRLQDITR